MVLKLEPVVNPISLMVVILFSLLWLDFFLQFHLTHVEDRYIRTANYTELWYLKDVYTIDDFKAYQYNALAFVRYYIRLKFFHSLIMTLCIMFEIFKHIWDICVTCGSKLGIKSESRFLLLYTTAIRTLFLIVNLPIPMMHEMRLKQNLLKFLLERMLSYARDMILIFIFAIPMNALTKYLKQNTFILLGILAAVVSLGNVLINFDWFSSAVSTENTPFHERLQPILSELGFPEEQVFNVEEESHDKVYLQDTWLGKKLIITGPLPTDKNISLFNATNDEIQFSLEEVVSQAAYEVGGWFSYAKYKRLLVIQGHIFTCSVLCYHFFEKEYLLDIAGFRTERPPFVNFILLLGLIVLPYWAYFYGLWDKINNYRQITEKLYVAMRFHLHKSLIAAFVKEYKMDDEFPVHHYWFALLCGYNRPLDSLILTLVSEDPSNLTYYW